MTNLKSRFGSAICLLAVVAVGCGESVDPEILAARKSLVLDSAPEAPQSITDAKELAESPTEITLVGRIQAGDLDPFDQQVAGFILSDLPTEHELEAGHDAENCPFCKRRAEQAPKAHVTMIGEADTPVAFSAPKLLGVKKGDQVIVRGNGVWKPELNLLEVKSTGIYLGP